MLSKFYSDAVGSLIRETTSNALDSHREINSSEPIIVSFLANDEGNYEFSVEDFGVGINKDTINNILRKYGKSTKRNSVNQLGAFGLN
jgi:DNA topoisomerase VI subunit B